MDDFRAIVERYLAGELEDAEQAELTQWLAEDEANRQAFLAEVDFYRTVRGALIQEQQDLAKLAEDDGEGSDVFDAQTLEALREIQRSAQDTPPVPLEPTFHIADPAKPMPRLTAEMVWELIPKRIVAGAIAAAVLLAGTVFALVYLAGQGEAPSGPIVNLPTEPDDRQADPLLYPVATLSAERDAQWQAPTGTTLPSVGDALHANQRLTLIEGFAKITTNRGAVAIIEAPATVELTHNDNAINLIQGKLVGICETQASKGFVVRTPAMEIVDLGTRFGVAIADDTHAHVLEGTVQVDAASGSNGDSAIQLTTGQTAAIYGGESRPKRVAEAPVRFVGDWQAVDHRPRLSGDIRYELALPSDLREGALESEQIVMYHEQAVHRLDTPIKVTLTDPGTYDDLANLQDDLPSGSAFDSFFVHLDPPAKATNIESSKQYKATIRFDRPILAVIATSQHLKASHAVLGRPATAYSDADDSGIERSATNEKTTDRVTLSDDRKTLTVELYTGLAMDQLRILVQQEPQAN